MEVPLMITLINVFAVEPANQQRLVDLLARATDEFVSRAPGFLSATLHRSLDGAKVTMSAQWRSREDYEAMRRDPGPLPFLQEALTIARFEPGMYRVVRQFAPAGNSPPAAMTKAGLSDLYRAYLACLNAQDWARLGQFVHDEVRHNGERIGLSGYRGMLEKNFREIPDLSFRIHLLIAEPPRLASRLAFDCTPTGKFLGLDVGGKRVSFTENVFYEFREGRIAEVWSVIDKAAIEAQISATSSPAHS